MEERLGHDFQEMGGSTLFLSSGRNVLFKIPGRTETKPEIEFGFLEVVILKISWDGLSC